MKNKKINKNNLKFIIVMILIVIALGLIVYGVIYASKHIKEGNVLSSGELNIKYSGNASAIDAITLPIPSLEVNLTTLPKTTGTLTEINFATFKTLFQTNKKSILILEKTGCEYCEDFEPKFISALESNNATAYKINISNFSSSELSNLYDYVDFNGTPTTYIINNGKAIHSYSGDADSDTISAFIEYFYTRTN